MKIKSLAILLCVLCYLQVSAQKKGFVVDSSIVATSKNINYPELELIFQKDYHVIGILPLVNAFDKAIENVNKRALDDTVYLYMKAYQYEVSYDYSKPTLLRDKLVQEGYYFISDFELSQTLLDDFKQLSSAVEISPVDLTKYGETSKYLYRFSLKGACPTASYIEAYYPVWKNIILEHEKREKLANSSITNVAEVKENSVSNEDTAKEKDTTAFFKQTSLRILIEPKSGFNSDLKGEVSGDWMYHTKSISVEKLLSKVLNDTSYVLTFSSGIEIAHSRIEVNSASGLIQLETFTNNDSYIRRTYWRNLEEQHNLTTFKIPISLGLGRNFTNKFTGIFEFGITPTLVLNNTNQIKEGTFDFRGYFSQQDIELSNISQYGFVDNVKYNDYDMTLKTKGVQLALSLKTNFIYDLNERFSLISQLAFNRVSYPFYSESNTNNWFGNAEYYGVLNNENIHNLNYLSFKIGLICNLNNP